MLHNKEKEMYKQKDFTMDVGVYLNIPFYPADRYLKFMEMMVGEDNLPNEVANVKEGMYKVRSDYLADKANMLNILGTDWETTELIICKKQTEWLKEYLTDWRSIPVSNMTAYALQHTLTKNAIEFYHTEGTLKWRII